jgi:hypothetical protein
VPDRTPREEEEEGGTVPDLAHGYAPPSLAEGLQRLVCKLCSTHRLGVAVVATCRKCAGVPNHPPLAGACRSTDARQQIETIVLDAAHIVFTTLNSAGSLSLVGTSAFPVVGAHTKGIGVEILCVVPAGTVAGRRLSRNR